MPRPKTKAELIEQANAGYEKLWETIAALPKEVQETEFDFSDEPKLTEQHWGRDRNVRDVLVHLYEWHRLLIRWLETNLGGGEIPFLPEPYTFKNYGDMNMELWRQHQGTPYDEASRLLMESHERVMALIEPLSDEALFTRKYYRWTGTTHVASYCISATSSHYDWAIKKLRKHARKFR
ncbi:MAG: hypothetical protein CSA07_02830 [Bacteroidia bacterium]|nr:MAG: hypothetical protein CSA07_02830 [Bacteroidia bacterium]